MNKKRRTTSFEQVPYKGILPSPQASFVTSMLAGLVFSSVAVVAETTSNDPSVLNKPTYSLKIISHGEGANHSDNLSEPSRQDNRRTDVKMKTEVQDGYKEIKTVSTEVTRVQSQKALNRSIRLNDGGVVWVTKDPAKVIPKLNVTSTTNVEIEKGTFVQPISFTISTNYSHFIDTWELAVYKASDEQLKKPLVTFMGKDLSVDKVVKWNGKTSSSTALQAGDKLIYILTAKSKKGNIDETHARQISLIGPERNLDKTPSIVTGSNALENNLKRQTIAVNGSTVRVFGRDIANGNKIAINDNVMTLSDNKFVTETILPEGKHKFSVDITDNAQHKYSKSLDIDLKGKYLFMVGLADITLGEGKVSGNLESLSDGDDHLDGDIFVDGRLAFYLKGKVKGKYLITAQMDTETAPIDELFDNIHKKDPQSIFRRLDPDQYYPVYGDDSTVTDDTDSQGKMYVRVEWDKSKALWGNYNTDITGTELSSFNRSLYGAKLDHRSTKTTSDGDHKTDLTVFASEAQSAFRHNEFRGTGGSLYYLKDTDIVDGSEKVWIEIRQSNGERVIEKVTLEEGRDYQIDDFQGRIILNRPLLQIAEQSYPSLIKDTPLDGDQVYLIADYEYVPDDFDSDKASYGARGKVWLNDHFAVGGTYAHEDRLDDDYELKGLDFTFKKNKGTYIKGEYAESESNQTQGSFASDDGGLNFNPFNSNTIGSNISGSAYSLEARVDLEDISSLSGSIGAWFKERDKGFSTSNLDTGNKTTDIGVEAITQINEKVDIAIRATQLEKEELSKETTASVQADVKVSEKVTLSGELKHVKQEDLDVTTANTANSTEGEATLGAFKVGYDLNKDINLYAIAQGTIDKKGAYENNDLLTLGIKAAMNSKLDVRGEFSSGSRGDAVTVGADYRASNSYSLYSNFTLSTDRTDNNKKAFTVGQRKSVSDQLKVYTEHQFTHETTQSGVGHTFGLDYQLNKELVANLSVQTAKLDKVEGGLTDREAFSVGLNYKEDQTEASTRLEYRKDKGATEQTEQWVTTNRINHRLTPSLRLQGKLNYSETNDQLGKTLDAKFAEVGFGFAYRPVNHDRHNILGRVTYLYDLQPLSQNEIPTPDEKSLIASLENSYQVNQRWEIGGKLAHKQSEIRSDRDAGIWEKNDASLVAIRARYHVTHNWDAMAQYHWLNSKESEDTEQGALMSVDRHIGKNMKVGIGYNFTDFDDDLSDTSGDAKGWFVNLVGKI
jgi:hypothetical protein